MNYRTNCGQVTRARKSYGQRHDESKYEHGKIVPPARRTQGKGSMWASKYHDASADMETYTPNVVTSPRSL